MCNGIRKFSSVQVSHSVMSDSLQPHGLQHTTPPCPSPTLRAGSNSCALSWWCHPTISSSVVPFSSCLQSFPASGPFPMSQLFASGGKSTGASALVLPMNISHTVVQVGPILTVCPGLWGGGEVHWAEPMPEKKWKGKARIQEWWGAQVTPNYSPPCISVLTMCLYSSSHQGIKPISLLLNLYWPCDLLWPMR